MHFTSTANRALDLEQIAHLAPSAVATTAHASRSERYTYIPTIEVIKGMQSEGFFPVFAKQSTARDESKANFTKHMVRFRRSGQDLAVGDVFPEIVLVNSHDGSSAYELMAGLWRLACSNGMTVSESTLAAIKVRHTGNIVHNVIEGSFSIAEQSQKTLGKVKDWTGLQLTDGEQGIFAEAAHTLRFADENGQTHTPITPRQLLDIRRTADSGNDLWRTFNRVQENTVRGGLTARTRSGYDADQRWQRSRAVTTREIKGIDQDVKLNRALWTLAEKMAELKGQN
jgi:hypothetical protein